MIQESSYNCLIVFWKLLFRVLFILGVFLNLCPTNYFFKLFTNCNHIEVSNGANQNSNNNFNDNKIEPVNADALINQLLSSSNDKYLNANKNTNDNDESLNDNYVSIQDDNDEGDVPDGHHAPHRHHNRDRANELKRKSVNMPPPLNRTSSGRKVPENDELLVNTQSGYVRGRAFYLDHHLPHNPNNRHYPYGRKKYRVNAWLGIPFGEKPIGKLRFKRPVPVKSWDGVLNATELPNSCYQLYDSVITEFEGVDIWNANTNLSEDCLYLNIWTPHPKPRNSAVMVWIYGGGFASGTSTLKVYDPRIIVSETQVIYVSIQYRLSIFGFLYMNHEDAPGNQGLLDQYLALKWIHNNIQYFGGDSSKITIFGESAGSVSVSLHLLSPLSSNLFRNAIMESGTALADWTLLTFEDAIERNSGILRNLGCDTNSTLNALECARRVEPKFAIEKADEYFYSKAIHGVAQFTFLPVVDNYFLEEQPLSLINRGKFKKCPILLGGNKDEGNWLFVYAFPEYRNLTHRPTFDYEMFKDFVTSLYYFYPQFPAVSSRTILNAILYRYTNWHNVNNDLRNFENLDDAAGDFHFICPMVDFANIYAMHNQDVYFYYYTQRSSRHYWPDWMGVMHGDEISFVFGEPLYPELNFTHEEKVLTRKILKYWSNFAKYSNPNGPTADSSTNDLDNDNHMQKIIKSNYPDDNYNNNNNNNYVNANANYRQINRHRIDRNHTVLTQTFMQKIEYWPKYVINMNPHNDYQRAYLNLNSEKVYVGYNLRAEYCAFWGTFLPTLVLSESRCSCGACIDPIKSSIKSNANPSGFTFQSSSSLIVFFVLYLNILTT